MPRLFSKGLTGESRRNRVLLLIDCITTLAIEALILFVYPNSLNNQSPQQIIIQSVLGLLCLILSRMFGGVYRQVWRFGGTYAMIRLCYLDAIGGCIYLALARCIYWLDASTIKVITIIALNMLAGLLMRIVYRFLYEKSSVNSRFGKAARFLMANIFRLDIFPQLDSGDSKIRMAIVGAGRVGVTFAKELIDNPSTPYRLVCFIDTDRQKVGREIYGVSVLNEADVTLETIHKLRIQEVVFALPRVAPELKRQLYNRYKDFGVKVKTYDYTILQSADSGRRQIREFEIEDLLFRQAVEFTDERTRNYYKGKTVLITGGGGSIGSELCRQIARMEPKQLIVLDVYENGAYDIQQELRIKYGSRLDMAVEIASICDVQELDNIFQTYKPDIVLHAAAHKHVPLMEHNCCEAIKNNVFGTLNVVEMAEKHGVSRFIMISTDKAVNPTNVMGATKRMCEMIVLSHASTGKTVFTATRFGNVLGSNGSVIPLFRRQIMNGGPVTITDERIIRYFMTIPEASQLVLQSGPIAKNGELFVLDMGKPVHILELAENMVRMSGYMPYKDINIIETGLRPGEKLYEELLIRTEELDKTENSMIFIERDKPLQREEITEKLDILRTAVATGDDITARNALKQVIPSFHEADEVNKEAIKHAEMHSDNAQPDAARA